MDVFSPSAPSQEQPQDEGLWDPLFGLAPRKKLPCSQGAAKRRSGCGSKLNSRGYAGFGPCFHLPGFHFGYVFLEPQPSGSGSKLSRQGVAGFSPWEQTHFDKWNLIYLNLVADIRLRISLHGSGD